MNRRCRFRRIPIPVFALRLFCDFGFGACGGTGKDTSKGEGSGGGTGAGGGVKPVAVLVINQDGIRLEPIKSGTASVLEKVAETIGKTATKKEE